MRACGRQMSSAWRIRQDDVSRPSRWCSSSLSPGCRAGRIATALEKDSPVTTMSLERNGIGDEGAARIAAAWEKNSTLTIGNLAGSVIGANVDPRGERWLNECLLHALQPRKNTRRYRYS